MLRVTNSLTRQKEEFIPLVPGQVRMYVCGPTVYDYPHLGHAVSYVAFDVIVRYLRFLGNHVRYVQNITDVGHLVDDADEGEDKILKRAALERVEPMELVETYTYEYFWAMDQLNVLRPDISPRASGHIPEMIEMIKTLIEKGHAYEANGSVYFDVAKYPEYGKLSNRRVEEQEAGARVEIVQGKRHPADFALWKKAEGGHILRWPSPWGEGFPGWHIECSAMSMRYLGETFDLHGAGMDNLFPHNEDEVAQSECANGKPFARYWLHNGSLTIDGVKMSKSLGNFITVRDALKKYPAPLLRYFLVSSHYRAKIDYSDGLIEDARKGWERLRNALENADTAAGLEGEEDAAMSAELAEAARECDERFREAMDDDFNTPAALAALFELATEMNRATDAGSKAGGGAGLDAARTTFRRLSEEVLGLTWPERESGAGDSLTPQLIELLIELRGEARASRDWKTSDAIRDRLKALGVLLEDRVGGGTGWRLAS